MVRITAIMKRRKRRLLRRTMSRSSAIRTAFEDFLAEILSFSGILTEILVFENTVGVLLPVDAAVVIDDDALVACANVEDDTLVVVDNVVVVVFVVVEVENDLFVAVNNVVVVGGDDVVDEMVHSPGLEHSP